MQLRRRRVWLLATSSLVLLATSAQAQTAAADPPQQSTPDTVPTAASDIVVTGARAALENAERTKRRASVLVDGISADDIGALPDVSIADSLVRIPGLTANTQANGFGQVSIRGLGPDLTMTQYNGRVLPTESNGDRRVDLGSLPTEGISAAYIQKTPEAATIEGGLAGIIDQESIKPLETTRHGLTLVVRGLKNEIASRVAGPYYGLMSTGFRGEATYVGRPAPNLGIAITYSRYQVTNNQNHTDLDVYQPGRSTRAVNRGGIVDAYPNNVGPIFDYNSQNRDSVLATAQWNPVPALRITADGFYIHNHVGTGPIRPIAVGAAGPTAGQPALATGAIDVQNGFVDQFQGNVSLYRVNYNNNNNYTTQLLGGLNLAYDNGGPLKMKLDGYYAKVVANNHARQAQVENDAATAAGQTLPFAYDARDPDHVSFTFTPLNTDDWALAQITTNDPHNTDIIKAVRGDVSYEVGLPLIKSLGFGVKYDQRTKSSNPNNALYTFGTNLNNRPDLDFSYVASPDFPWAHYGYEVGGPTAVAFPLFDIEKLLALRTAPNVIYNAQEGNDVAGRSTVDEKTIALYGEANLELGKLSGNAGVRYFQTRESVFGYTGTTEANKVGSTVRNTYHFWLPALNLRYDLTDKLDIRFAASKTLSRPTYGNLRIGSVFDPTTLVAGVTPIVSVGNPNLAPYTAKNLDLSAEWYPNSHTSIAIQGFYKWVSNFVINTSYFAPLTIGGVPYLVGGQPVLAQYNSQTNDPVVHHFRGIEIIARRDLNFLPWYFRNLGIAVNYNHNISDATDQFASVAGFPARLSTNNFTPNIVNAQLYYATKAVDLRLVYRYYDRYSRQIDNAYQYTPGGQLDFSGSVEVIHNVWILGTIRNLNNSKDVEYARDGRYPDREVLIYHDTAYSGRQFTFGVRAQF